MVFEVIGVADALDVVRLVGEDIILNVYFLCAGDLLAAYSSWRGLFHPLGRLILLCFMASSFNS